MPHNPGHELVTICTKAWLETMRREWHKRYGAERKACPVPSWEDLPATDRLILMRATQAALSAAEAG